MPYFCPIFIYSPILFSILTVGSKRFTAMAVWPFIISKYKKDDLGEIVVNHEKIHFRQQLELLFIFFFLWYTIEYLVRWVKLGNRYEAYRAISFEKEAYGFEANNQYLQGRSWFAWLKFL